MTPNDDILDVVLATRGPLVTRTLPAERADEYKLKIMELGTIRIRGNPLIILSAKS